MRKKEHSHHVNMWVVTGFLAILVAISLIGGISPVLPILMTLVASVLAAIMTLQHVRKKFVEPENQVKTKDQDT